jgi:hypothetical protein
VNAPSLPSAWIDRLFSRLQALYGSKAATILGAADPTEVRQVWSDELGQYGAEELREALDAMRTAYPEFPPTLFQFAGLCRESRARKRQMMTLPNKVREPMPEHIREQFRAFKAKHIL